MMLLFWIIGFIGFGFCSHYIDRKIVARIQSRVGPPWSEPDLLRLSLSWPTHFSGHSTLLFIILFGIVLIFPMLFFSSQGLIWMILVPVLITWIQKVPGTLNGARHLLLWITLLPVFLISPTANPKEMLSWNLFHNPFTFMSGCILAIALVLNTKTILEIFSSLNQNMTGFFLLVLVPLKYFIILLGVGLYVLLFLGGWDILFFPKVFLGFVALIWLSHALPSLNTSDEIHLYWKRLTPIAFFSVVGSLVWIALFKGMSVLELILSLW